MIYYTKNGGSVLAVKSMDIKTCPGQPDTYYMDPNSFYNMSENPVFTNHLTIDLSGTSIADASIVKVDEKENIWRARLMLHNPGDVKDEVPEIDSDSISYTNYMLYSPENEVTLTADAAGNSEDGAAEHAGKSIAVAFTGTKPVKAKAHSLDMIAEKPLEEDIMLGSTMCAVTVLAEKESSDFNNAGKARLADIVFIFRQSELKYWKETLKALTEMVTGKEAVRRIV